VFGTLVAKSGSFKIGSGEFEFTRVETPTRKGVIHWDRVSCEVLTFTAAGEYFFLGGKEVSASLDEFSAVANEEDEFYEGPFLLLRGEQPEVREGATQILHLVLARVLTYPSEMSQTELFDAVRSVDRNPSRSVGD
jgi:hypothetical protein